MGPFIQHGLGIFALAGIVVATVLLLMTGDQNVLHWIAFAAGCRYLMS